MSRSTTLPADLTNHRAVVPFLPLVCAAWTGPDPTGEGMAEVVRIIQARAGLHPEAMAELAGWLDRASPPSPVRLQGLCRWIRDAALGALAGPPESLSDLGLALARSLDTGRDPERLDGAEWGGGEPGTVERALREAEAALGVAGAEAARDLLSEVAEAPAPPPPGPRFRPEAMHRFLEGPWFDLRQEVLELLSLPELRIPGEIPRLEHQERTLDAVRSLVERGYGLLGLPREYGGGGDVESSMEVFETLALGDLGVVTKFGVQFGLFGGSVLQLGTERHHERYLGAIGRMELPGCFAMTEVDHGSNVRELETRARFVPSEDEFRVHTPHPGARKDWIGNAGLHGRMATVFARLEVGSEDHGIHAFLVPIRDRRGRVVSGVEIEDCGAKVGLNGVDNGRITFHDVRIPRENLLDRFGGVDEGGEYRSPIPSSGKRFFTMLGTLVTGRISIAAAAVSVAKTAVTIGIRYSLRRRQFGPAGRPERRILDFRTQQRLLLPALAGTYGLHFAVRDLRGRYVRCLEEDEPGSSALRAVEGLAAGLKAAASHHALETVQAAREACGGEGYRAANRLGRLRADADVFTTFEGVNVVLLQLLARGLLTEYRDEMGDLRFWDTLRYLADRASVQVSQKNPVVTRRVDEEHLRDFTFHRDAFAYREARLLRSAARRLRNRIDSGMDSFDALIETQTHLVRLAQAHLERKVIESFQEAVARAPSPGLSEILRALCQLHALARLEADAAWFLQSGYMEPQKSRAVRSAVDALCAEVREQAVFLVDGFGIPDPVLRAPAGRRTSPDRGHDPETS